MAVSRRRILTSVVPGSVLAAAAAEGIHLSQADHPAPKARLAADASPAGDVVGKITVGYQGWFACIGDGAPIDGWWHWSNNWSQPPSAWGARTQTLTIEGSTDGSSFTTLAGSKGYGFDPAGGNTATATFTANTGWPAGQLSELQVYAS